MGHPLSRCPGVARLSLLSIRPAATFPAAQQHQSPFGQCQIILLADRHVRESNLPGIVT